MPNWGMELNYLNTVYNSNAISISFNGRSTKTESPAITFKRIVITVTYILYACQFYFISELKQLLDTLSHRKSKMQTKEQLQLSNAIYGEHIYFGTCTYSTIISNVSPKIHECIIVSVHYRSACLWVLEYRLITCGLEKQVCNL